MERVSLAECQTVFDVLVDFSLRMCTSSVPSRELM
jgi:hypothetical protein